MARQPGYSSGRRSKANESLAVTVAALDRCGNEDSFAEHPLLHRLRRSLEVHIGERRSAIPRIDAEQHAEDFGEPAVQHDGNTAIARSEGDAPEIDGVVHIGRGGKLPVGEFVEVDISGSSEHDLEARIPN